MYPKFGFFYVVQVLDLVKSIIGLISIRNSHVT